MSILSDARKAAKARQAENKKKEREEAERSANRSKGLEQMKKLLFDELKKLDGGRCKYGTFRVDHWDNDPRNVIALLWIDAPKRAARTPHQVAWFKAAIVSGTADLSDDCRGIPYTEARVWARFYPPDVKHEDHDGTWDLEERRLYHNGGRTESMFTPEDFFKFMTEQLAEWF